tara:strand:- start:642 stop:1106 length:465 start_codon:yes stop_codon:yes gene_type:complete
MYKKIIILLIFVNLLTHCGFAPVHLTKSNIDFSITSIKWSGDKTINRYLKSNLNNFINSDHSKKFQVDINTKYEKNIISKDKSAKITNYQLVSTTFFKVNYNNLVKTFSISEKKSMNNINDKFEEQKYERTIKQNFASTTSNKLISELSLLNDN